MSSSNDEVGKTLPIAMILGVAVYLGKEDKKEKTNLTQTKAIQLQPQPMGPELPASSISAWTLVTWIGVIGAIACLSYLFYEFVQGVSRLSRRVDEAEKNLEKSNADAQEIKDDLRWHSHTRSTMQNQITEMKKSIEFLEESVTKPYIAGAEAVNAAVSEIIKRG